MVVAGAPLGLAARYRVVVNSFLATGGDNFLVLVEGTDRAGGPADLDALIAYVRAQPASDVDAPPFGRIALLP